MLKPSVAKKHGKIGGSTLVMNCSRNVSSFTAMLKPTRLSTDLQKGITDKVYITNAIVVGH